MTENKCFCHLNGYEVKDATARKMIEDLKFVITFTLNPTTYFWSADKKYTEIKEAILSNKIVIGVENDGVTIYQVYYHNNDKIIFGRVELYNENHTLIECMHVNSNNIVSKYAERLENVHQDIETLQTQVTKLEQGVPDLTARSQLVELQERVTDLEESAGSGNYGTMYFQFLHNESSGKWLADKTHEELGNYMRNGIYVYGIGESLETNKPIIYHLQGYDDNSFVFIGHSCNDSGTIVQETLVYDSDNNITYQCACGGSKLYRHNIHIYEENNDSVDVYFTVLNSKPAPLDTEAKIWNALGGETAQVVTADGYFSAPKGDGVWVTTNVFHIIGTNEGHIDLCGITGSVEDAAGIVTRRLNSGNFDDYASTYDWSMTYTDTVTEV